ncbi:insulinase family protein, partial [bacterium]|nr:insulinase family protein [bacterium]
MLKNIFIIFILSIYTMPVFAADYTIHKLSNGQTLIVKEVKNNPIVTIDTWVQTGSLNENNENSGVSHFLEHLFFKGTKKYPTGEFDKILESKGAIINAATSKDFTHYYITIPAEHFKTALELHADMLSNPQIPRKELEMERKVVLEEIAKDLNTPSKITYDNLNSLMYTNHPYKRKVIGSADVISTIRREEILEYFNRFYMPANMTTLIIGDIDTEAVIKDVERAFRGEYKKPLKKSFKHELPISAQKRVNTYAASKSGYMMIGFRSVPILNNDTFAIDLLAQILGGGKTSRLSKNVKDQKGLVYSISAYNMSLKDDGMLIINASFNPSNSQKIENSVFDEILSIQKYGVTEEELQIAKKVLEQDTYYSRESTSNIASELGYIYTLTGSADLYDNYLKNINKVTVNDIKNVANKYLGVNKSAVSITLPEEFKLTNTVLNENHSANYISSSDGVSKYIIDNGTTLLLNSHNNNDIIAISLLAKGGKFLENKIGEGNLAAATILRGTKKYSAQELAQLMEENGIKISPANEDDMFIINIQTTVPQLDLTLNILDEILNNALFEDYEIEKKRAEMLGIIKQKQDIPMNVALLNFNSAIFKGSVYSNTDKVLEKSLPIINREDVIAYYNKIFDSKNVVVSVNGNADLDKLVNNFGKILKDKKQPVFDYSKYQINKLLSKDEKIHKIKDLETAWMFLGWQVDSINNIKDHVTLKMIDTVLGNGMSSRIYKSLREQDGLAYQLGTFYSPKKLKGAFVTYIGTNPATLDYAKDKILNEIQR